MALFNFTEDGGPELNPEEGAVLTVWEDNLEVSMQYMLVDGNI